MIHPNAKKLLKKELNIKDKLKQIEKYNEQQSKEYMEYINIGICPKCGCKSIKLDLLCRLLLSKDIYQCINKKCRFKFTNKYRETYY